MKSFDTMDEKFGYAAEGSSAEALFNSKKF